jgi:hypothetical protein
MKAQASELLRFITNFKVDYNGEIVTNLIDSTPNYISRFYTPRLGISTLSTKIIELVNVGTIQEMTTNLSVTSIVYKLRQSKLKNDSIYAYQLAQAVCLECFGLIYALENDVLFLKYISKSDITRTKDNIAYILDYVGADEDYIGLVDDLHEMYTAVGYLEQCINTIKEGNNIAV